MELSDEKSAKQKTAGTLLTKLQQIDLVYRTRKRVTASLSVI